MACWREMRSSESIAADGKQPRLRRQLLVLIERRVAWRAQTSQESLNLLEFVPVRFLRFYLLAWHVTRIENCGIAENSGNEGRVMVARPISSS